jgi:hypothetical protein
MFAVGLFAAAGHAGLDDALQRAALARVEDMNGKQTFQSETREQAESESKARLPFKARSQASSSPQGGAASDRTLFLADL